MRRSFSGRTQLPPEDLATTIDQSDNAIGTMEELLRDLLRFATPTDGQGVPVNLVAETQATMNLLGEEMRRSKIDVQSHFVHPEITVSIDPARLRFAARLRSSGPIQLFHAQATAGCARRSPAR